MQYNKILVIIPCYNNYHDVHFTLSHSTKSKNIEYLLFDSSDNEDISSLSELYKTSYIKNEINLGRVENWNLCIELAIKSNFRLFKFLFAGDVLNNESVASYFLGFKHKDVSLVTGPYNIVEENQSRKIEHLNIRGLVRNTTIPELNMKYKNWFGPPSAQAYRTESIKNIRFDSNLPWVADWLFAFEISNHSDVYFSEMTLCEFNASSRKTYLKSRDLLSSKLEELFMFKVINKDSNWLFTKLAEQISLKMLLKMLWKKLRKKVTQKT
ncbi:hypothetical protein [Aliivibrio fischeri]|uniref:hypothetical protein n=1 Tax=Aliivibrio fischeri TaxID=668 RepID=UPI0007C5CB26|nr:hypothetical protein [Aliivibrio fischeri]